MYQPSPVINLFPPPVLNTSTPYSPEGGPFYHPGAPHLPRPRYPASIGLKVCDTPSSSPLCHRLSAAATLVSLPGLLDSLYRRLERDWASPARDLLVITVVYLPKGI